MITTAMTFKLKKKEAFSSSALLIVPTSWQLAVSASVASSSFLRCHTLASSYCHFSFSCISHCRLNLSLTGAGRESNLIPPFWRVVNVYVALRVPAGHTEEMTGCHMDHQQWSGAASQPGHFRNLFHPDDSKQPA